MFFFFWGEVGVLSCGIGLFCFFLGSLKVFVRIWVVERGFVWCLDSRYLELLIRCW